MHLLEAGVNLIYIRDLLGHTSVVTTEIYAKTNPKIKEEQLKKHNNTFRSGQMESRSLLHGFGESDTNFKFPQTDAAHIACQSHF